MLNPPDNLKITCPKAVFDEGFLDVIDKGVELHLKLDFV